MSQRIASARILRALTLFVALFFGCGGSQTDTHTAEPKPVASAQPSASVAPSAAQAAGSAAQAPASADAGAATASVPQVAWRPLLYRIAGSKPSYLFGTIHIPDDRLAKLPGSLDKAIADSDEIVNEMPLDEATQTQMASSVKMPRGKRLSTSIPAPLLERVKHAFSSVGIPDAAMPAVMAKLDDVKVWAIAVQIALIDHMKDLATGGKGIDSVIYDRGQSAHKRTTGLETAAEQLAVFDGLTADEQARVLEQALDERDKNLQEHKDPIATLMNLYIAGDEAPLLAELNRGFDLKRPLDQKLLKRLITDRNKIMADRIDGKIKSAPPRSYFVAIGAAHLLGDDGVIAQLKKKGYAIERVP